MKLTIAVRTVLLAALASVGACGSDNATGVPPTSARIRIVNSVFQYTDATSSASNTVPAAIDVLIDSTAKAPGAAAIAPVSIASFPGANASLYEAIPAAVHSFVARLPGDTGPTSTFFTNASSLPYLPRQALTPGTPYTLVVAGIIPASPAPGGPHTLIPPAAVPFTILTDDPFQPPLVNGSYQTRFRVINAAPFAAATGLGATLSVYLSSGTTAPASTTGLTLSATALFRNASVYINANPGVYTLTVAASTRIIAQTAVTFAAGEVRTYVVQSTGYAAAPSPANHVVQALLDNKY